MIERDEYQSVWTVSCGNCGNDNFIFGKINYLNVVF